MRVLLGSVERPEDLRYRVKVSKGSTAHRIPHSGIREYCLVNGLVLMGVQSSINAPYLKKRKSGRPLCIPNMYITIHHIGEDRDSACVGHAPFEAIVELMAMTWNVCVDLHFLAGVTVLHNIELWESA